MIRHLIVHTAEAAIGEAEKKPGFSVSLLQIVATEGYGATARLASALYFKNYIKRNWTVDFNLSRLILVANAIASRTGREWQLQAPRE